MEVIRCKWWIPLVPVSYYSAYKLTEIPPGHHQFDLIAPNQPQKIREEQFKTGHLHSEFLRLIRGKQSDVAGELQTSIVRYQKKSPNHLFFDRKLQVDLVGVVHVGDKRYYQQIQNQLRSYDCVLFEGEVHLKSTDVKESHSQPLLAPSSPPDVKEVTAYKQLVNSRSQLADKLGKLGWVHQTSVLFEGQNWKHADLPRKTMLQLEEERLNRWWKERLKNQQGRKRKIKRISQIVLAYLKHVLTLYSLWVWFPLPAFVPLITYLTCSRNGPNAHDIDKLEEIFKLGILHYVENPNPKFFIATEAVYKYSADYEGDSDFTSKAVVIRERNKFVMEVLKETIAEGKTSIAILYGAGHMPDFHKRLVQELNMVPVTVDWYTAWSIKEGPKSKFIYPLLDNFLREYRTFFLGSIIFCFLVADLWAWRKMGIYYWVASWVFRFECFVYKIRKEQLKN